ncbi:putative fibroblast growth factor 1 [Liparis tanakae]|uniref:Putative fibroblast growth factor 1 n=1 Tax=Liparis tanakae TaxID=230148 RepID=A0A4Z2HDQ7_9TELE|nr:putative fibroblast growth factor 1 [Liparis tanakae]
MTDEEVFASEEEAVVSGSLADFRRRTRLYCMNGGHHLQMLADGTVQGRREDGDAHSFVVVVVVALHPGHHGGHQLLQLLRPPPARLQHLLVVGRLPALVVHHRALLQHAALGDGLEGGASQHAVHALTQEVVVAEIRRRGAGETPQLAVVGVGHGGEAHAKPEGAGPEGISASPPMPEPHTMATVGRTGVPASSQSAVARHSS